MTHLSGLFDRRMAPPTSLSLAQQRRRWLVEFLKTYAVLVIVDGGFYLLGLDRHRPCCLGDRRPDLSGFFAFFEERNLRADREFSAAQEEA